MGARFTQTGTLLSKWKRYVSILLMLYLYKDRHKAMREKQFIKQNIADWQKLWQEANYALTKKVSEHASFARTFYPNRRISVYLNHLVVSIWLKKIRSNRNNQKNQSFWLQELPLLLHEHRIPLRVSLIIFLVAMIVGMVSSIGEGTFMSAILGEDYVAMTFDNIQSGDPMRIYKQKNQLGMATGITANNLFISLLVYVLGLIGGLGSIGLLISNGVLVGSFQYLFISEGFFRESFLTIWTHGLPEITAIILSGGAGLTLGKGVISGNASTFRKSARDGFKILMGIVPMLIFAGFAEGYLTRFTNAPDILRIGFIVVCLIFILIYFVWFPSVSSQWVSIQDLEASRVDPEVVRGFEDEKTPFYQIHTAEEILKLSFKWMDGKVILMLVGCALVFLIITIWSQGLGEMIFPNKILGTVSHLSQFFKNPIQGLILGFIHGYITLRFFEEKSEGLRFRKFFGIFIFPSGFIVGMMALNHPVSPIVLLFLVPVVWVITNYWWLKEDWSIGEVLQLIRGQTLRLISLQLNLFVVALILIAVFDTYFVQFTLNTLTGFLPDFINAATSISKGILTFTFVLLIYGIYSLTVIAMCWMTGTLLEIKTGRGLKNRIKQWLPVVLLFWGSSKSWTQTIVSPITFDKDLWKKEREVMNFFEKGEPVQSGYLQEIKEILERIPWDWVLYILSGLLVIYGIGRLIFQYYAVETAERQQLEGLDNGGLKPREVRKTWTGQDLENFQKEENWLALIRAYHAKLLEKNRVSITTTNRAFKDQFSKEWKRDMVAEVNKIFERGWYGRPSNLVKREWDDFYRRYEQINSEEDEG
jgi:uncharacterized membrane protein SpoIIM required for sporulation